MASYNRFCDILEESFDAWLPIKGLDTEASVALEAAIKKIDIDGFLGTKVLEIKQKDFEHHDELTIDEASSIYLYTIKHTDPKRSVPYRLNKVLRSKDRAGINDWLPYLKLFVSALEKLPPFQGTIYCGFPDNASDRLIDQYIFWGFNSCVTAASEITDVLRPCNQKTIFHIKCMNARSIHSYASDKNEYEVLLVPGTCLKILGKRTVDPSILIVDLQEVEGIHQPLCKIKVSTSVDEETTIPNEKSSSVSTNIDSSQILTFPSPHKRLLPHQIKLIAPPKFRTDDKYIMKIRGSLFGLAIGDALGASVEFRSHDYLLTHPVTDMQSGGTWKLKAGQWTDDTSMALCLASSLITKQRFDPYDQLVRYKWWYKLGFLSSVGHCFDIGSATRRALDTFISRQKIIKTQGRCQTDEQVDQLSFDDVQKVSKFDVHCSRPNIAGNGALMRLAPVPLFYFLSPQSAIDYAGQSAALTHGDVKAIDACRYYAAIIVAALHGEKKESLLDENFFESHRDWFKSTSLDTEILHIARGSYKKKGGYRDGIRGKGYIVNALEAALWAFWDNDSFESGVLAAIHLGDDTDTTAAIYGQLAGAYYDYDNIPSKWRQKLYAPDFILCVSDWLYHLGSMQKL